MPHPSDRDSALFKAIVDHAVGPMLVVDATGRVCLATSAMARVLGMQEAGLNGRVLAELVHPDDVAAISRVHARPPAALLNGVLCRLRSANGAWLDTELTFTDLRDDPAVQGVV